MPNAPYVKIDEDAQIEGLVAIGMLVAAVEIEFPLDSGEEQRAILFSFRTHDDQMLPPIVFVSTPENYKALADLVTAAIEDVTPE